VRTLLASALVLLAACGGSDAGDRPSAHGAPSATASRGPDPVVLRVPRAGGAARAYVYPALDSAVWRSSGNVPSIDRVLAFDPDGGVLAFVDGKGRPARLDLRLGSLATSGGKTPPVALASADAADIYGLAAGKIVRLTPTGGAWDFDTPRGTRAVVPQPDGSIIVVAARGAATRVWRVRPPDTRLLDSVALPRTLRAVGTQLGDRVYFVAADGLHPVRTRDLEIAPAIELDGPVIDIVTTPSGDRIYVAIDGQGEVRVIDRYRDEVTGSIELPGPVRELRMDALGRYLLARPAKGDSVWIVALGTSRVRGTERTAWRADLPFVLPDGAVALARGRDVVMVDAETLRERARVEDGADDFWHFVLWNGFRPRAGAEERPVVFAARDTTSDTTAVDSIAPDSAAAAATATVGATATAPSTPAARDTTPPPPPAPTGFTLSFAALQEEAKARALAQQISVDGERARVVGSTVAGTPIYRVVMGPYATREEAERRGRAAGRDFWVYSGAP
jgi:cell division septation protein DedD